MRQIPLDFAFPPRFGADDFLVASANEAAHATLRAWPEWPDKIMLLVGPEGSGKSHLASIWAERADARIVSGTDPVRVQPDMLADANSVIDDVEQIGDGETLLFHLLNVLREHGRFALLTAQSAPDNWGIRTPDLLSRLRLAPVLRIGPPDDALVRAVLIKLFADRQLLVDDGMVDYLAQRMERSIAAARQLVDALDRTSLAAGRRITRAIASGVLASLEAEDASRHGAVTELGQNQRGS